MQMSEDINELATALSVAQGQIQDAEKKSDNQFDGKYADLTEVLGQIRPIFSDNGLAIIQLPGNDGYEVQVTTMITHSSGQWIRDTVGLPIQDYAEGETDKNGNQKHVNFGQEGGKLITYLRRYAAAAIAGIAQEDVDGHHEAPGKPMPKKTKNDEETIWLNDKDFDRMLPQFATALSSGSRTADQISKNLREKYGVSKKMEDKIKGIEYEADARSEQQEAGSDVGDGDNLI